MTHLALFLLIVAAIGALTLMVVLGLRELLEPHPSEDRYAEYGDEE